MPWGVVLVHTLENIKQTVELVNMRLQQSMGDLFHNQQRPALTSPGAPA